MNVRAAAATVICRVVAGVSLTEALPSVINQFQDARDQALLQALCYGVCRWYFKLDAILNQLLPKPLKTKDNDVHSLLLIGLYQLSDMRIPAYAVLTETVSAAVKLKKPWAKNLVNAVLRNYQRRADTLNQAIQTDIPALYSHPTWLIEMIKHDWPEEWQAILAANNEHPPLVLRVNAKKISRENYMQKLQAQHIKAYPLAENQVGIRLQESLNVQQLPGFMQGEVSVQDGAAQLAAALLDVAPEQRVLDACAAPGGKTAHILESYPMLQTLIAVDKSKERLQLIQDNLQRLQLSAKLVCADAAYPKNWWDGQLFDRILLDVPCSASGVIRRHPDIKLLRRATDIANLAAEQTHLLTALWSLLKVDGLMVYATCSILSLENSTVVQSFLATQSDAREVKISAHWGKECVVGRQILPGMHGMDGFYFACLRKCATTS